MSTRHGLHVEGDVHVSHKAFEDSFSKKKNFPFSYAELREKQNHALRVNNRGVTKGKRKAYFPTKNFW